MAGKSHRNRWRIFQCHRGTCQKECCRWDSLKITWKRLLYNLIISSNSITTNQDHHHHHHPKSWSAGHHKVWPRVDGTVSTSTSISLHQFPGEVDISKVGAPPLENHRPKSFLGAHSLWYHQRQVVNTCQHQWYRKSQYSRRQNPLWTPKTSGITHRHPNVVPIQKIPPAVFFPHVQTA